VVGDLIGEGAAQEQAVVGETPNLAARLQTQAEPGTVLICPNTRRLIGGHFDYRDVGPLVLKGWAEPVPVWQVIGTSGVESRFEAMHKTKLPPLFGREEEIELLLRRWRHATQEEGRVVVLTGEPGIGKSHIALALDERLQSEPHITLHITLFLLGASYQRSRAYKRALQMRVAQPKPPGVRSPLRDTRCVPAAGAIT
jgi:AAA ATPase domain